MATQLKTAGGLYEDDRYAWALEQAALLRAGRLAELDLENLIDEVEDMAASDWRAARSHLGNIIEHLLKLEHSPARDPRNAWRASVREQRRQLESVLTATLRRRLEAELPSVYARMRKDTAATLRDHGEGDAAEALPTECPYAFDDLIGDWLPPRDR